MEHITSVSRVSCNAGACVPCSAGGGDAATGEYHATPSPTVGIDSLTREVWARVKRHPCFSEEAHHHFARMHVAVAPTCNIQCRYCNRKYTCANESRPGVTSRLLSPEQAAVRVLEARERDPRLTVVGIAGPGDALASPRQTFETLRLIRKQAPDLIFCLSTNGLALPDQVEEIVQHGVDHVTITINTLDPDVGTQIYAWVAWGGQRLESREGVSRLIERQIIGLQMLVERGVLVKVNSVLVPGVNDQDLVAVNEVVKARGAFLHNIIPLLSEKEHGTEFGLSGRRGPSTLEFEAVLAGCDKGAKLMRHCHHCRADSVGLLCEGIHLEQSPGPTSAVGDLCSLAKRRTFQNGLEAELRIQHATKSAVLDVARAQRGPAMKVRVAVVSQGGGRINEHFGRATGFLIYELEAHAGNVTFTFLGHRRADPYCHSGLGKNARLTSIIEMLFDCDAVLAAAIGAGPLETLRAAGIEPVQVDAEPFIEAGVLRWFIDCRAQLAIESSTQPLSASG